MGESVGEVADTPEGAAAALSVVVVLCTAPRHTQQWQIQLPPGAIVADALGACGLSAAQVADFADGRGRVGIWGRATGLDTPLQERDRVEIYRPLKVDPKVARRERFAKQGARATGLFANKRPGAKAGY
jgi:sulfur carrier protein